jgi:hypothetical protein
MARTPKQYDDFRDQQAALSREASSDRREIKAIPPIKNLKRRAKCRDSLKLFCETYNPKPLYFNWSEAHLKAIARIEESVKYGALFAFAMPRGSGKTVLCRMASLWAASYALCRYVFLISATDAKAGDNLDAVKNCIRFLPKYVEDFPEITHAVLCLKGIANRASGQTCLGESTMIEWSQDAVVFPTVPVPPNWPKTWKKREDGKAPTSGTIIVTSGLTGEGIRGSLKTLNDGDFIRPDFVLLDDPQTTESATSLAQNTKRLGLITNDVLGMAGPGRPIAGVMPCTVIARGDMIDEVLNRKKHPLWRGERTKMLSSFPKNLDAWRLYFDVFENCAQLEPPNFTESNNYYLLNRSTLDEGAAATWADRINPTEVSAIQGAMHLYFRDRAGFMAEYQNEPLDVTMQPGVRRLAADSILARLNGVKRGEVPRECVKITGFIDPGRRVHWYCFIAWTEKFGGSIIDYGTWPPQRGGVFNKEEESLFTLEAKYPGMSEPEYVHSGLQDLCNVLVNREYMQQGTGAMLRADHVGFDSGFLPATVHQFVRTLKTTGTAIIVTMGDARTETRSPVSRWKRKDGEVLGHHWIRKAAESKRGPVVTFDADEWKTFAYNRFAEHFAGRSPLRLYGAPGEDDHRLFAGHMTAECGTPKKAQGAEFEKWSVVPNTGVDNDFFDTVVGCSVTASVSGLTWTASETVTAKQPPVKKISLKELQEQRRREKESKTRGVV